jgi:hypothetical protein
VNPLYGRVKEEKKGDVGANATCRLFGSSGLSGLFGSSQACNPTPLNRTVGSGLAIQQSYLSGPDEIGLIQKRERIYFSHSGTRA